MITFRFIGGTEVATVVIDDELNISLSSRLTGWRFVNLEMLLPKDKWITLKEHMESYDKDALKHYIILEFNGMGYDLVELKET